MCRRDDCGRRRVPEEGVAPVDSGSRGIDSEEPIVCGLCFHKCALLKGQTGFCRARGNIRGRIVSLNYGRLTSLALDPIEKKPFRLFMPGSMVLSAGSFGCNMRCPFCQNYEISMAGNEAAYGTGERDGADINIIKMSPQELAEKADELKPLGNAGVAYTYNEPLVGYEFVMDCAKLVHDRGMVNVLVTNGMLKEEHWRELLPFIDAVNIDLKGFTPEWYRRLGGDLETVMRSIEIAAAACHVEVTTLLVPGENDSSHEVEAMARWLASVDPGIALHLSRFFPRYRMTDRPPAPVKTVYRLADEARAHLKYVYTGNC